MSLWPKLNALRDRRIKTLRRTGNSPKQIRILLSKLYPAITVNIVYKVLERRSGKDRRKQAN